MTAPETPEAGSQDEQPEGEKPTEENLTPEALRAELKRAREDAVKYRQRARQNQDAAAKLAEIEQSQKTEVEKLTEKSEGLLHRAAGAEHDLMRLRVALSHGVASDQVDEFASRLRGETEDELKADAEKLAKFFAPQTPARRGDPSQGAGGDQAATSDPIQAALEGKLGIG